jgi:hypothetical protein
MRPTPNPNIRAWIVAIEKYGAKYGFPDSPDDLDIPSPIGAWALALAQALLGRGVPGPNIVLSVSLPENDIYTPALDALRTSQVTITGATVTELQNAAALIQGKGLLLTYWVGHGIMDSENRYLLAADSRKSGDLSVVSADSLLKYFRKPACPRLQIGFFDCCAQVVGSPNIFKFGGEGKTATDQYFYHASSATDVAPVDATKTGFSSTVLDILALSPLPPEPSEFFPLLRKKLDALSLDTRPFLLQYTDRSGDRWSREGGRAIDDELIDEASRAQLTPSQFEHVLRQARKLDVKPAELSVALENRAPESLLDQLRARFGNAAAIDLLSRAWLQTRLTLDLETPCKRLRLLWPEWLAAAADVREQDSLGRPESLPDLPALMLSVLDQNNVVNGQLSFIRLIELAARRARASDSAAADALVQAVRDHATLGPLWQMAVSTLPRVDDRLHLLLDLRFDLNTRSASLRQAWIYLRGKPFGVPPEIPAEGTLAEQISAVTQAVIARFHGRAPIVELLAPNDLLCAPQELFQVVNKQLQTSVWLEAVHALTMRWQERMKGYPDFQPGIWIQAAQRVRTRNPQPPHMTCLWLKNGKSRTGEDNCSVVALSFPGPSPAEPQRNRGEFFKILLETGAPYMCWPRRTPAKVKAFQTQASLLIGRHDLDKLPHALVEYKKKDKHVLHDLILFIDEPERNPYDEKFEETRQRGAL